MLGRVLFMEKNGVMTLVQVGAFVDYVYIRLAVSYVAEWSGVFGADCVVKCG